MSSITPASVARARREWRALTGPVAAQALYRRLRARVWARLAAIDLVAVGPGVSLEPTAVLAGTRLIHIGASTNIGQYARLKTSGSGEIHLGARVWVGPNVVLNSSRMLIIEDDVLLAGNCFVSTHRHAVDGEGPIRGRGTAGHGDVRIGRGAWLASNVVVSPGVTIGAGAVVGANSVVTSDVPAQHIAAGAPARILRAREAP